MLELVGLSNKPSLTNDLKDNRIRKSQSQIKHFIGSLNVRISPFDSSLHSDFLFNISTGESAPSQVAEFLTSVEKIGQEKREQFIHSCECDPDYFNKGVIKKVQIQKFPSLVKQRRIRLGDKVTEIKVQKDIFGRLLAASIDAKIDMPKVQW